MRVTMATALIPRTIATFVAAAGAASRRRRALVSGADVVAMLIDNIIDLYNYVEYLRGIICISRMRVRERESS